MAELLINEFFSTYPFHMFAYLPFHTNLRYPGKITILLSALAEIIYLAVFAILVHAGFPAVSVQYLAIPILGFFLYHLVQANIGIVTFQYTFVLDYLMVIRASSFFYLQTVSALRILHLAVRRHYVTPGAPHHPVYDKAAHRDHRQSLRDPGACNLENRMASSIFRHDDHLPSHRQYPGWEF